ncbi:S-adenosylmethionine:tRNA ribosyltransferase-isomerase [uncultured Paludibacter sp.]|nr:S-adenosylmethionine:tRNA ribosyltransferase-isomerase [uncultured Paludibacter sp.]
MKNFDYTDPIFIEDFNYNLPDERIAKYPLEKRDSSKLLIFKNHQVSEDKFYNIGQYLPENALLVYNNTRVIQARLIFHKPTGARIEVFCLEPISPSDYALSLSSTKSCVWKCLVGNLKKWKEGKLSQEINWNEQKVIFSAEMISTEENTYHIRFSWDDENISFSEILMAVGELPIPPYLHRKTEENDKKTYQTVYSKIEGSVAAPTAGLHFTPEVFKTLKKKNIETEELTLHVGAGTFQPVKSKDITDHTMHAETISVKLETIKHIQQKLGNIVAVGTTSVRTLESLYWIGASPLNLRQLTEDFCVMQVKQWEPYQSHENIPPHQSLQNIIDYLEENQLDTLHADTQIMIKPGYDFKIVDAMITNFHQPKSTLLLLVSAFVKGKWKQIYDYALANDFRFLSYGDSSILFS